MTTTATEKRSTDERGNGKDRRRKERQRKRIDMIGIEQNRNGKVKHGEAWKRKRKATQRTATEWYRIAMTGPETE